MTDETSEADARVICTACQHYRAQRCHQAQQAGLSSRPVAEVGSTFATTPQHCSGFKEKK